MLHDSSMSDKHGTFVEALLSMELMAGNAFVRMYFICSVYRMLKNMDLHWHIFRPVCMYMIHSKSSYLLNLTIVCRGRPLVLMWTREVPRDELRWILRRQRWFWRVQQFLLCHDLDILRQSRLFRLFSIYTIQTIQTIWTGGDQRQTLLTRWTNWTQWVEAFTACHCAGGYCSAVGGTERLPEDVFVSPLLPCHRAAWGEDSLHAPVFRWSRRGTAWIRQMSSFSIGNVRLCPRENLKTNL